MTAIRASLSAAFATALSAARLHVAAFTSMALAATLATAAAADARPDLSWLRYDRSAEGYEINRDLGDTARHEATPIWSDKATESVAHVMLVIPKKSVTAYSVSVNAILATFRERRSPARFSIWFYDSDEVVARESIDWAESEGVDLIMTVGSDATQLFHELYRGPGKIPVVTSASKDPVLMGQVADYDGGSGDNFAFTSINVNTATLLTLLRQVFPDLENIWVIYASQNTSAIQTQLRPLQDHATSEGDLRVGEVMVEDAASAVGDLHVRMPEAVAELTEADPERSKSIFWVTGSTSVYAHIGLINELSGGVPVLAALPDVVRPGPESALFSIGVNQSSAVHLAALYAVSILEGRASPGELPVGQVSPPDIAINFMKVEEMGITLPFTFFEDATFIYDRTGRTARAFGQRVRTN